MAFKRKMFKKRSNKFAKRLKAAVLLSVLIWMMVFADKSIKEIVSPMAIKNAEMIINAEVNEAISALLEQYPPLFSGHISENYSDNKIQSIETDAEGINKFKTDAIVAIENRLQNYATIETAVQIGNIINSSILSNRGPSLYILYDLCCSVNAEIKSQFKSAGINQTQHIIKLYITVDAYLSIFCDQTHTNVITDYIIGETVIVGETPAVTFRAGEIL